MNFIHGNGPRKDVCANCGVNLGLTTKEEATNLFSNEVANARMNLVSRRWAPFFWIVILWNAWYFFLRDVDIWNWVIFGFLILISIFFIALYISLYKKYFSRISLQNNNMIIPFIFLFFVEIFPLKSTGSFFTTGNSSYLFLILAILVGLSQKDNLIEKPSSDGYAEIKTATVSFI